ncbi:MAG: PIN domain-containing protein [Actinobacteria bacterium]|nr:PIN domain-containing protein [Actinomycetota bacterium]
MVRIDEFTAKLNSNKSVSIDSSFFIYHLENIKPYNELTSITIKKISSGELFCNISTLVISELFVRPFKEKNFKNINLFEEFIRTFPNSKICDFDFDIAKLSAKIRAQSNLRTPDAVLIATAIARGSDVFITNDLNIKKFSDNKLQILVMEDYIK